ncbi:uncharacterized protein UMAG_02163 [Mycosarcoma maydis]|uniref:Uncharacterized protein n=1 Tax=Mycosarcoma maydis TaxID=5270 RepID=A0A0D1CSY2_MYCMD|nr:uncharacterized protein UMAG_02163 [Ustilago maydis 521]KIS69628.1 hypothetical protein UMAG_02163 [Ustilago maydis 521]|eukprot:XP_011388516.1 hypothetical protein UMAG_02163 [Ustilago maydis 521]
MTFDIFARGGCDMASPRARFADIINNLGDALPAELNDAHREDTQPEPPQPRLGLDPSPVNKVSRATDEAGPRHDIGHHAQLVEKTEFETKWDRLPTALAALPSFCNIKQLVLRNSTGQTSFRLSLCVLSNGIDQCYLSRPTFRQVLLDLDGESGERIDDPAEDAHLLPRSADALTLTEALWESHFGVPRHLRWYSAQAEFEDGVASCISSRFAPPNPGHLGLSCTSIDSPVDVAHCAVAGTKRPLYFVGPTCGLLYIVVQGSLLVVSWPSTSHNFDTLLNWNSKFSNAHDYHYDDLEEPHVNLLRTGDTVYLAAGTINLMVALSHVALTSRQVLNPTSEELNTIVRCCHRLMDSYIEQQKAGFSPFDEFGVQLMDTNLAMWTAFASHFATDKPAAASEGSPHKVTSTPAKKIKSNQRAMHEFLCDLRKVKTKIERYRMMVSETSNSPSNMNISGSPCFRPLETLNALAVLSSSAEAGEAAGSTGSNKDADTLHGHLWSELTLKSKDCAPS